MTSSPPDEENERAKVPGWRQPWDPWRVLMMGGSVVLLVLALLRGGDPERLPQWFQFGAQVLGYALLGIGFFLAMKTRKKLREDREKEKRALSPRDRG